MKRVLMILVGLGLAVAVSSATEKAVKMQDLPEAVRKTVQQQAKGAELKGLSKETENGKTFYEAETRVKGHGRDILIDSAGNVVEVEEETALDSIPSPARAAIERKAAGGKITRVETVTKGGTVAYEAAVAKAGKRSEVAVAADGSSTK